MTALRSGHDHKYLRFGVSPVTTKNDHAQQALPGRAQGAGPRRAAGAIGRGVMLLRVSLRVDVCVFVVYTPTLSSCS